ncbi:hypothetical protein LguiB_013828 [Lonicera macranthoides]
MGFTLAKIYVIRIVPFAGTKYILGSVCCSVLDGQHEYLVYHQEQEREESSIPFDTDFGYHELLHGEEFYWKFHNHVFEKTLYFCHFYWGNMDKVFDVFNDRKAFPSCADGITTQEGKCYWLVKNDGFYSCKDKCEPNNLSQWNKTVSWIRSGCRIMELGSVCSDLYRD